MGKPDTRVIAVDWSGEKAGGRNTIWLAEVANGQLIRLENGRTRAELIACLIDAAVTDPNVVVGIDFAFGMPAWFVEHQGAQSGPEFWGIVAKQGETWLDKCPQPFWGRKGTRMPRDLEVLRWTERQVAELKELQPSSTFKIGGAGQVGTGTIRGMPFLEKLRLAGWRIAPFDPPGFPMAVEIYPRLFADDVVKTSPLACLEYLTFKFPKLDPLIARLAASSEDAFDAAISALVMDEHRDDLLHLRPSAIASERLEGRIWMPI
jgi:hypothetical protein